jgi:transcriptional regulator with XRE-family HTH domain
VYGKVLRKLRESRGRAQAEVARTVGISPAHLARLETNQRGLYLEDFVKIAEALGEKPGNLLPNDLGDVGYMKPLIDRLAEVDQDLFPRVSAIVDEIVRLTGSVSATAPQPGRKSPPRKRKPPAPRSQKKRR